MYQQLKLMKNYKQRSSLAYCHKSDSNSISTKLISPVTFSIFQIILTVKSYFQISIWIKNHSASVKNSSCILWKLASCRKLESSWTMVVENKALNDSKVSIVEWK